MFRRGSIRFCTNGSKIGNCASMSVETESNCPESRKACRSSGSIYLRPPAGLLYRFYRSIYPTSKRGPISIA